MMHLEEDGDSFPAIRCTFTSPHSYYILPFWGVPAQDLFNLLSLDPTLMKRSLLDDSFKNSCCAASPVIRLSAGREHVVVIEPPHCVYFDERTLQTHVMHLVVIMLIMDGNIRNREVPYIFAKATAVHVPAVFSSIIARTNDGQNFPPVVPRTPRVNGIYVRKSNSRNFFIQYAFNGSMLAEIFNLVNFPVCMGCYQRSVNTVVFPCLHASVCSLCLFRCFSCPICHQQKFYFFITGPWIEMS